MSRICLATFACLAGFASGCIVSTPSHQLPQGYSESYRRILRDAEESTLVSAEDQVTGDAWPASPDPIMLFPPEFPLEDEQKTLTLPPAPEPLEADSPAAITN